MIAPNPKIVRAAIRRHQDGFDINPENYLKKKDEMQRLVLKSAAQYFGVSPDSIALTESTTMGLAVVLGGMQLYAGEEVITTYHEHYACSEILRFKAKSSKCLLKKIRLYEDPSQVSDEQIIENVLRYVTPATRVIMVTWVHSCTGVKIPIAEIGTALKKINLHRPDRQKIIFCVDGLHGLGIEDFNLDRLQCDFFIAGTHKSLFGPRGTGIVWGSDLGWSRVNPLITSFDAEVFGPWYEGDIPDFIAPKARLCSPGGFSAFEHKWALSETFHFHLSIGKKRIQQRVYELNSYAKEKMKDLKHLNMLTPISSSLSSGMICFTIPDKPPRDVVDFFETKGILIGQTPYRNSTNRFAFGILNNYSEIDHTLEVLQEYITDKTALNR